MSQDEAEASEKKALTQAAKADAINSFLIDKLLRQASPENNPAAKRVTLLEVLDRAAAEVGTSFEGQPEIEAAIRIAIGQTYHDLGDYSKSEAHYRAAYEILKRQSDETVPGEARGHGRAWATASLTWVAWKRRSRCWSMRRNESRRLLGRPMNYA